MNDDVSEAAAMRRAVRLYRAAARVAAAELPEGSVGRSLLLGAMVFHDEEVAAPPSPSSSSSPDEASDE